MVSILATTDEIVTRATREGVVITRHIGDLCEIKLAGSTGGIEPRRQASASAAEDQVTAVTTEQGIRASAALQEIITGIPINRVVARQAMERIVAALAFEVIIQRTTFERAAQGAVQIARDIVAYLTGVKTDRNGRPVQPPLGMQLAVIGAPTGLIIDLGVAPAQSGHRQIGYRRTQSVVFEHDAVVRACGGSVSGGGYAACVRATADIDCQEIAIVVQGDIGRSWIDIVR